jgi:hypothetical protein
MKPTHASGGSAAESVAGPITNAMVTLAVDLTLFRLTAFATVTPFTVMLVAPRRSAINGDTRNSDGYLCVD